MAMLRNRMRDAAPTEEGHDSHEAQSHGLFKRLREVNKRKPVREITEDVDRARRLVSRNQLGALKKELSPLSREQRLELFRRPELRSALHLALPWSNAKLVVFLLRRCGVGVDERDKEGLTPLYRATRLRLPAMVRLLLKHGADVQAADEGARSCRYAPLLLEAVQAGDPYVVEEILRAGADPFVKDLAGEGFSHYTSSPHFPPHLRLAIWKVMKEKTLEWAQKPDILGSRRVERLNAFASFMCIRPAETEKLIQKFCPEDRIAILEACAALHHMRGHGREANQALEAAMNLRWKNPSRAILKEEEPDHSFARAIGTHEPQTSSELVLLSQSPHGMDKQVLLILERIFPESSLDINYACGCVRTLLKGGRYEEAMVIFKNVIVKLKTKPQTHPGFFFETLADFSNDSERERDAHIQFEVYLSALEAFTCCLQAMAVRVMQQSAVQKIHDLPGDGQGGRCHLCTRVQEIQRCWLATASMLLEQTAPSASKEQLARFDRQVDLFIQSGPRIRGQTVFHNLWVSLERDALQPALLKMLLKSSVRLSLSESLPQASRPSHLVGDIYGRTPLHIIVNHLPQQLLTTSDIIDSFLEEGAHLCTRDGRGVTIQEILEARGVERGPDVPPLLCQAAKLLAQQPNWTAMLPAGLNSAVRHFVEAH